MIKKTRFDGKLIKDLPSFTRFMPFLMPNKTGSVIYYEQDVDVSSALLNIKRINKELLKNHEIITLFGVIITAAVRTLSVYPKLNRFISGNRYWQRNEIQINFVAKKEITEDGKEVNVKISFPPNITLSEAAPLIRHDVKKAISDDGLENEKIVDTIMKMPSFLVKLLVKGMNFLDQHNLMARSMIESDPMWCSIFMTNVGSFGLDAPYHHLFERGNCPIFISVGKVREEFSINKNGEVEKQSMLTLRYTFDDRIADGVYMAKGLTLIQSLIENPDLLLSAE